MSSSWIGGILSVLHIYNTNRSTDDPERTNFNVHLLITLFVPIYALFILAYHYFKYREVSRYTKTLVAFGVFMIFIHISTGNTRPENIYSPISETRNNNLPSYTSNSSINTKLTTLTLDRKMGNAEQKITKAVIDSINYDEKVCNTYSNEKDRSICFKELSSRE